jgi:hypothetical protein
MGRPRSYRCLLGMVDTKHQQRKNSKPRRHLSTQQFFSFLRNTQYLLTNRGPQITTPPRLQSIARSITLPRATILMITLLWVTSPRRLSTTLSLASTPPKLQSITLQSTLLQYTILMLPITIFLPATTPRLQPFTLPNRSNTTPKRA